ncbi:MAG TPA: phosphopantetheine-binding protein [Micromonosporaceae bacterium]
MGGIGIGDLVADLHSMASQLEIEVVDADVTEQSSFDDLGIDSLGMIDFLIFLERKYHVKIADDQLNAIDTLGDMLAVLNQVAAVR